jgi:hypothetical protein
MLSVVRKRDCCEGESSFVFDDKIEYIRKLIDLYAVCSGIDRAGWLPEREIKFLTATVIIVNEGIDNPISKSALQIYEKYYNFKATNKTINTILTLLEKRGWLTYDAESKKVKIPGLFYNLKDCFEFKVNVSYDKEGEINRHDYVGGPG